MNTDLFGAFAAQLAALERCVRQFRNDGVQVKKDEEINRVLKMLGGGWPLRGSAWEEGDIAATVPGGTEKQTEESPAKLLDLLLEERGRTAYALSHGARRHARGVGALANNELWMKLHRAEFARLGLELLAGFALPDVEEYRNLPLNILVVDNNFDEIGYYNELLPPELGFLYWNKACFWRVDEGFKDFQEKLKRGAFSEHVKPWPLGEGGDRSSLPKPKDIDLIIQDQFLDVAELNGTDLARSYYETMPQALVFLTTGLDVQALATLGQGHYIDRTVPKHHLAALPWYYYLAFTDIMGSMFWESWLSANETDDAPLLERRKTIRALVGALRRWKREPEILWHGQALPEMVDHGNEHITDLWHLTDRIVGARHKDQKPAIDLNHLTTPERVLVALGIWLHDIGHRGDEYAVDPASIRDVHGSISERLILRSPEAFGLEWLMTDEECGQSPEKREERVRSRLQTSNPTPLRQVGLLCRHHQSSAPLFREALAGLHYDLKFASDYARIAVPTDDKPADQDKTLDHWRDQNVDLDWLGHDVRVLEDYVLPEESKDYVPPGESKPDLLKCACLLRFLDGIHQSRPRAGSSTRIKTHRLYRDNRKIWVRNRRDAVQKLLRCSPVGSKAYLDQLSELLWLTSYEDLLEIQDVHLWRQYVVHKWAAKYNDDENRIEVTYELVPSAEALWDRADFKPFREKLSTKNQELEAWRTQFKNDVFDSELKSHTRPGEKGIYLATNVFEGTDLAFFARGPGIEDDRLGSLQSLHEASM